TWSKNLTNLTNSAANSNYSGDLSQQYGPAAFGRPHRLVVSYRWDVPRMRGWTISGVTVAQSGTPLTITDARGGTIFGVSGSTALTSIGRAQLCPGAAHSSLATAGSPVDRLGGASGGPGYW